MTPRVVAGADLMWRGETVAIAVGPLVPPGRGQLERGLGQLAANDDATRIGWQSDPSGRRWQSEPDLAAFVRDCVHEWPDAAGDDPGPVLVRALQLDRRGRPLAVIACADMVVLVIDHILGDGYFMTRLLGAVVETATTGVVPEALRRPAARRPLPGAVWDSFGRHPGRACALARHVRTASAPPVELGARSATDWRPSPASRIRLSDPQALKGLKEWRREHASGISTVPLTIAAAEVARRRLGIPLTAPPLILFDARRYVRPGGVDVAGNFCAGLRITVTDSGDPLRVDAAIKEAVELGRPLAVVAATAATLRLRRGRRHPTASAVVPPGEAWDVAYTHMGRPPELSRLHWAAGAGRPYFVGLLPPNGPAGVTIGMSEMGHRMNVSVSFHDNVVRAELVDALLDLLVGDPAALLEQHRSGVYQPMVA